MHINTHIRHHSPLSLSFIFVCCTTNNTVIEKIIATGLNPMQMIGKGTISKPAGTKDRKLTSGQRERKGKRGYLYYIK